jgi:predicted amidohydrolase
MPVASCQDARMSDLVIAAAQPSCAAGDVAANAAAHASAIAAAGARVVVFPELSLTGYELGAPAVAPGDPALGPVVEACAAAGAVALVGAPVADDRGREFIATLRVDGTGAAVAYRKMWLGDAEAVRFTAGDGPVAIEIDGRRIGLGICKDTGVAEHAERTAALGVDVFAAGVVHHAEELAEQDARGARIARRLRATVVFASCAAPTGGGFHRTAGHSTIWSADGSVLARAGAEVGEVVSAPVGREQPSRGLVHAYRA